MLVDSHCHLNYLENPQNQLCLAREGVELGWLTSALGNKQVVGVGEAGLDYSRPGENDQSRRHQLESFAHHLELADRTACP